jgi:hypothetical protein
MVQRIVKMMGGAYSTGGDVQVRATYNGSEIVNGPVATTVVDVIPQAGALPVPALDELVLFETTTETTGQMPVTISVTGGTLFFSHFWMNYSGFAQQKQATDPNVPIDPNDPSTYVVIVTVYPDSYYGDPNTNTEESDGISNLTKNGEPWTWRVNVNGRLGDWTYPIADGETVTFDFYVDPADVILVVPD